MPSANEPYERFEKLLKGLARVPKHEADEKEAAYRRTRKQVSANRKPVKKPT